MSCNLLNIYFNLFGIDHTIAPLHSNDSVAFRSFTMSWNLSRGYKTKVRSLTPKISTITSNEEKEMIKPMEMHKSINTCFSMLKFLDFVKILVFGLKIEFFTISENEICKK